MKTIKILPLIVFCFVLLLSGAAQANVLEFIAETGFDKREDKIVKYKFLESEKKIILLGEKNLQVWDYESGKLLSSVVHGIPKFENFNLYSNIVFPDVPPVTEWNPVLIDPQGKWGITIEHFGDGDKKKKMAVVRDVSAMKQIALLELPENSIDSVSYDEGTGEVIAIGIDDKTAAIGNWKRDSFKLQQIIPVTEYKWHQFIKNGEKIIVGSGETKINWSGYNIKQGNSLVLRDVKTGAIEKEFTAPNLLPRTPFRFTLVTKDEKTLISVRDDRLLIWDIDGNGQPRLELSDANTDNDFGIKSLLLDRYYFAYRDKDIFVYDIKGDSDQPKYHLSAAAPEDSVRVAAISADQRYVAVTEDGKISVIKTESDGKPLYEIVRDSPNERFNAVEVTNLYDYLIVTRNNRKDKKPDRTEIYDVKNGKLVYTIPENVGYGLKMTADGNFLYGGELGFAYFWNFAKKQSYKIPLETYTTTCYSHEVNCSETTSPSEYIILSPNEKFILRYGEEIVSIFDIETGKEIQQVINPKRAKYNKFNKLKDSGIGTAFWSPDGKFVYAYDSYGIFYNNRTISFWRAQD